MTTATPIAPPQTPDLPPPLATPAEPTKKGHTLLWLALGGLALLLAIGVGTFFFLASGDEEAGVVNDHAAEPGEPALVEVPGYAYTDPSPGDVAAWDDTWTQTNEDFTAAMPARFTDTPYLTSWSLHDVNRATWGADFLGLGVLEVNPQITSLPGFDPDTVVTGMAGGMATEGTTVTTETIDGETVAIATTPQEDLVTFAWYHEGTINMTAGEDEDAARTFAEAYITEQNS